MVRKNLFKVRKDDRISEVIKKVPQAAPIMMKHGVHCVGCHAAYFETIEQGSLKDGLPKEEVEKIVEEINNVITRKKSAEQTL
jgi:hybrid cluster-associated redox disulfide protein